MIKYDLTTYPTLEKNPGGNKINTFFVFFLYIYTVNGYYIYIETSLPRVPLHRARLVSPTLAAVEPNSKCQVSKARIAN